MLHHTNKKIHQHSKEQTIDMGGYTVNIPPGENWDITVYKEASGKEYVEFFKQSKISKIRDFWEFAPSLIGLFAISFASKLRFQVLYYFSRIDYIRIKGSIRRKQTNQ